MCPGTLGTNRDGSPGIDTGDAPSPCPDGDDVQTSPAQGQSADPCIRGVFRSEVGDPCDISAGPSHIKGDHVVETDPSTKMDRPAHPSGRTREKPLRGGPSNDLRGSHPSFALHDVIGRDTPNVQDRSQGGEIAAEPLLHIGIQEGRGGPFIFPVFREHAGGS